MIDLHCHAELGAFRVTRNSNSPAHPGLGVADHFQYRNKYEASGIWWWGIYTL